MELLKSLVDLLNAISSGFGNVVLLLGSLGAIILATFTVINLVQCVRYLCEGLASLFSLGSITFDETSAPLNLKWLSTKKKGERLDFIEFVKKGGGAEQKDQHDKPSTE